MITDIDERLKQDEWSYLIAKYPHVAFNHRNFNGNSNSKGNGYKVLVHGEPYITMPEQWDYETIKQYDGIITFNSKFAKDHGHHLNIKVMSGALACNAYYKLDTFKSYDERLNAACILNKSYGTGRDGDIVYLRPEIAQNLPPHIPVHVWSFQQWGGSAYKGTVESPVHHSHLNHLKKMADYRFCICLESSYHPYWSWDFMTERMFNCFKAKTLPIYMGCYNIEEHVPKDFFIDFRDFRGNYDALINHIKSISKAEWEDRTERAFEWNKTNRIGNIEDLESLIKEF